MIAIPNAIPKPILEHHFATLQPFFKYWQDSQKIFSVILLTGPEGVGKKQVAYFISQWILCDQNFKTEALESDLFGNIIRNESHIPCNQCLSCKQMLSKTNVNFQEIVTDESQTGKNHSLKVDQFRSLKESQGFGAYRGKHKIIFIPNVETMTPAAANSLLKILEEPQKDWVFLMTTTDPSLILPTLASRCQKIRLKPLSHQTLNLLFKDENISHELLQASIEHSQGSYERVVEYLSEQTKDHRNKILTFLQNPNKNFDALVEWASQEIALINFLVNQLEFYTEKLLKELIHENTSDAHFSQIIENLGGTTYAKKFLLNYAEKIIHTKKRLLLPLNKKILVQEILAPWLKNS